MSFNNPIVRLSSVCSLSGRIIKSEPRGRNVFAFLGVPYAEQPGRFEYPKKLELWTGCRDATKYGPISPQELSYYKDLQLPLKIPNNVSEQCLYLNVWTPNLDAKSKLPVMVWIHGGGFIAGWSNQYQGVALASECDVVFVSINYRLGAFGFMATEDGALPGNYGLMDQTEALRWVQRYVTNFGGDPDNVTIFGESAGAMSVALHVMSQESRGLFHRAISQSGTAFCNAFLTSRNKAEHELQKALKKLDFRGDPGSKVDFLRSVPMSKLVEKTGFMPFRPVIDGRLIPDTAETVYKSHSPSKVDFMMGCNSHEGALFTIGPMKIKSFRNLAEAKALVIRLVHESFWDSVKDKEGLADEITQEYLLSRNVDDIEELQKGMVELVGDVWFSMPTVRAADNHSEIARTYVYAFSHTMSASFYPEWVKADHASEMFFVLGDVYANRLPFLTEDEKRLSKDLMHLWADFARNGNPSASSNNIQWLQYDKEDKAYLEISGPDNFTPGKNFLSKRKHFWKTALTKYGRSTINVTSKY